KRLTFVINFRLFRALMARDKSAKERIMNLFIFEDRGVEWLEPLTLTRPAFDLRCGTATLLERHLRNFGVSEALALVRPEVAALCQLAHARLAVNEAGSRGGATILVNARWLAPATPLGDLTTPRLGLADNQAAYVVLPADHGRELLPETIDDQIEACRHELPAYPAGGAMINFLWDLVEQNGPTLCQDAAWFPESANVRAPEAAVKVLGPAER